MKRYLIFSLVLAMTAGLMAAPRSVQQAQQEAAQYFNTHANVLRKPAKSQTLAHTWTSLQTNGTPAFYVFNRGEEDGWVIIAADDQIYTVLGYSDQGHFNAAELPANAFEWLETYSAQIEQAATSNLSAAHATKKAQAYTPVAPIVKTLWGQREPYNNLCPMDANGERCVTGCPATAAAQIMRVHKYPEHGFGSNSYDWTDSQGQTHTLSLNFSQTTFNWNQMIDDYRSLPSTDEQKAAVATLMYNCGVASDMDYGVNSSGTQSKKMVNALIDHFGYDKGVRVLTKDYIPEDSILNWVATDLKAGRPVYISARTVKNEGHAFVCDGMDAEGLLSINWGWNGLSNGFFRLSAMNPEQQGTGGSKTNRGYTQRVVLYTNIHPDAEGNSEYYYSFTCENVRVETPRVARTEKVKLVVDTLHNRGFCDWQGNLKLMIYKDGKFYKSRTINESRDTLKSGYYFYTSTYNANFSAYPDGEYEVVVAVRADDQPDVTIPVYRKWLGEWRCKMTITADSIFVIAPEVNEPEPPEVADPAEYTFTQLSAYYYPSRSSEDQHRWKLQLATSNFYRKDMEMDQDEMLLLFNVYTHSAKSIVGNYPADTKATYRCLSATQYYGISVDKDNMEVTDATEGSCTVVYNEAKSSYTFRYSLRLYGKDYKGMAEIPLKDIRAYYGEKSGLHKEGDRITLEHQEAQAVEEIEGEQQPAIRKILRNGQILIVRSGELYTLTGERL